MSNITIYHNPTCGTSRNVLALIRNSGEEPNVIEYLKTPPDRETLQRLITDMGVPVRAVLREKGTPYAELGLDDPKWSDAQLIDCMLQHPILINRPIVIRRCRVSRSGGVFRYSMTVGSSPLLRIRASTLRDVPQTGL